MTRVTAKPFVAGAFAILLGGTMLSTPAHAGKPFFSDLEDDGSVTSLFYDEEDGHIFAIFISADGKTFTVFDPGESNPEGDATGPGSHSDKPDVVGLLKSGAATYKVRIAPADSPELMAHLQGALKGGGLGPRYNPGDEDGGHGHGDAPTHSLEVKKTPDEIRQEIAVANEIARQLGNIGAAMGDGDEGGGESPNGFNKNGKGGDTSDDGDYTEGQNKSVGQTEKDLLGAKPEVVNPPHLFRTTGGEHNGAAGGGSSHNSAGGGSAHGATGMHG